MDPNIKRSRAWLLSSCLQVSAALAGAPDMPASADVLAARHPGALTIDTVRQRMTGIGMPWVPNAGQWDERVAFRAQSFAGSVWVTTEGVVVHALAGTTRPRPDDAASQSGGPRLRADPQPRERTPDWVLTERFVTPSAIHAITGADPHAAHASFFIGADAGRHHASLGSFGTIDLGEVFPGVTVALQANGRTVEKFFTVQPHRDPSIIRVQVDGALALAVAADGALEAQTGYGPIRYSKPVAFQTIDGRRREVPVRYALNAAAGQYGFTLGDYDRSEAVTIDPLLQATFLGGGAWDEVFAMAVHPVTGEIVVAGYSQSNNFPCTTAGGLCATGAQSIYANGNGDAFVARLNPALTSLLQATYLGGSGGFDAATALTIDAVAGEVLVAGHTASGNFPCVTPVGICAAGAQSVYGGGAKDGFVARLNEGLTSLLQATFLGGSGEDVITAMAVHPASGEVLVAGYTDSTNLPCTAPGVGCHATTATGAQSGNGGLADGFVARLNATLTSKIQSTYLGGTGTDQINALGVHPVTGEIVVGGSTNSATFPCTVAAGLCSNGAQPAIATGLDAFVARLNDRLTILRQATYLGGNGTDTIGALGIHPGSGDVVVAGLTGSTNFPCTTAGGLCATGAQSGYGGGAQDGFVTRLNSLLTHFLQSTYVGGSGKDHVTALVIQPVGGEVLVAGRTGSTDLLCTTAGGGCATAAQAAPGGDDDGFIARFNADLTTLHQMTYLGGLFGDYVNALAIHPDSGEILAAGWTQSADFPCTSVVKGCLDGARPTYSNGNDAFVARISADLRAFHFIPDLFEFVPVTGVIPASVQTSLPSLIAGLDGAVPIEVFGVLGAKYCISSQNDCKCDLTKGEFVSEPGVIDNKQYVCVQHTAPAYKNGVNVSTVKIGPVAGRFHVSTGTVLASCSLDVDDNGSVDPLTDGLMIIRVALGLTGTAVTEHAIGAGAKRSTWDAIAAYLNRNCATTIAL